MSHTSVSHWKCSSQSAALRAKANLKALKGPLNRMPKRQQFHGTIELILRDERIAAEDKILRKLMHTVRRGISNPAMRTPLKARPALYKRYRVQGFPIKTDGNRKYPAWRSLSPWMKLQFSSMCIAEHPHVQVRLRLHDEIASELKVAGRDYRSVLRDRLTRFLRERHGPGLDYFFVLEDLDRDGNTPVRPHAHGMLMIPKLDLFAGSDRRTLHANERLIEKVGLPEAQWLRGRSLVKETLQVIVGNREGRDRVFGALDQTGNVWTKKSYSPLFNKEAISYAFKNVDAAGSKLPLNRVARSKRLIGEAKRFWNLVRLGEAAINQWPLSD